MGVLRERVEVSGRPEEFGEWLDEYTKRASYELFRIKDNAYLVLRNWLEKSFRDSYFKFELSFRGPLPAFREKPNSWFLRAEIRECEHGASTEIILSCNVGDDVLGYYRSLLKAIQEHWPEAKVQMLPEEPLSSAFKGPLTHVKELLLPFDRAEVYSHLRALCDDNVMFFIGEPKIGVELERLIVLNAQAVRQRGMTARGSSIGIVRLLPTGGRTLVMFVAQDVHFHEKITDESMSLFREFVDHVERHFQKILQEIQQPSVEDVTEPLSVNRQVDSIRVPHKLKVLNRWKVTWRQVKGEWNRAKSYEEICNWLEKVHPHLYCSPETLADIIRAGTEGLLE